MQCSAESASKFGHNFRFELNKMIGLRKRARNYFMIANLAQKLRFISDIF